MVGFGDRKYAAEREVDWRHRLEQIFQVPNLTIPRLPTRIRTKEKGRRFFKLPKHASVESPVVSQFKGRIKGPERSHLLPVIHTSDAIVDQCVVPLILARPSFALWKGFVAMGTLDSISELEKESERERHRSSDGSTDGVFFDSEGRD